MACDGRALEADARFKPIEESLEGCGLYPLLARSVRALQVNMGASCNMNCNHCHVNGGPDRKELMELDVMEQCLRVIKASKIPTVDITGGAPEMNPNYRWFVKECSALGLRILTRTNLSILLEEGYEDMASFFAARKVEVIASLPYYTDSVTDRMRGEGAFDASLKALRLLNKAGYGRSGTGLLLSLVYNPAGAYVSPSQGAVEADFRRRLKEKYDISFTNLFTITNIPAGRFFDFLERSGNTGQYINRLIDSFNPEAAANAMCRDLISVGWDGTLYDCDFSQMLSLKCAVEYPTIWDFDMEALSGRAIAVGLHCYACMSGAGSSCTGEVARA